jgi:PPOX class probable F420-dependent enzyme
MPIPRELRGQKYISLGTFRKSGVAVYTPVWFGESNEKLYVKTRNDSGKFKRIRSNPTVKVAPCNVRGKITGPEFAGPRGFFLRRKRSPRRIRLSANIGWRAFRSGARRTNTSKS